MRACMHKCVFVHTCACVVCIVCAHECVCRCVRVRMSFVCAHVCMSACLHTCMHTSVCARVHVLCARVCAHVCARVCGPTPSPSVGTALVLRSLHSHFHALGRPAGTSALTLGYGEAPAVACDGAEAQRWGCFCVTFHPQAESSAHEIPGCPRLPPGAQTP